MMVSMMIPMMVSMMIPMMVSMMIPRSFRPPLPLAWSCRSIRLGEVTCCGEITPRRDVKTLRLGTRFHQRKEDNSQLGQTVVLFPYLPESGQSRCLSLSPLVVIG